VDGLVIGIDEFVALDGVGDKTKAEILWDNCACLYSLAPRVRETTVHRSRVDRVDELTETP
jgi:hypothetical protein